MSFVNIFFDENTIEWKYYLQNLSLFKHILMIGTLYIVATPIGNIEDITLRAIKILNDVDAIYCEDTRQTKKILEHYKIGTSTSSKKGVRASKGVSQKGGSQKEGVRAYSLHAHSHESKIHSICDKLISGQNIAYLTDSGTPALSDPGSKLVKIAAEKNIPVSPIPGPSALTSLVSVSGFMEKNIIFAGFLSKKPGTRVNELKKLSEFEGIIVLYESPYRIHKLILAIAEVFPDKEIVIGREMTKLFEEIIRGRALQISAELSVIKEKGEFSIAILNIKSNKNIKNSDFLD